MHPVSALPDQDSIGQQEEGTPTPRKRIALFLGAGASFTFGVPLTQDLLGEIITGCKSRRLFSRSGDADQYCNELLHHLKELLPGLTDTIKLPLVTDLISLIDYSLSMSTTPILGMDQRGLLRLRELLARAIAEIVAVQPWELPVYQQYDRWLRALADSASVSVLTTNYDIIAERPVLLRLWGRYLEEAPMYAELDFGFGWRIPYSGVIQRRPVSSPISFFKLHGSVNWLGCEVCEHIYINHWAPISAFGGSLFGVSATSDGALTCHCDHGPLTPVIVAPSLVRDIRNANLLEIWKNALESLREADEWVIVGYSFPPEDLAIRSMFMRAWRGRKTKPKVTVVQYGWNRPTMARFKILFPRCTYLHDGFAAYLSREAPPAALTDRSPSHGPNPPA
ncbi:MAG TPA: hypothetical protein VJT67_12510 [Longimicrobiaceae bacterium]|nr:hypothetical protein [Longimicrobiaceae bacterium]